MLAGTVKVTVYSTIHSLKLFGCVSSSSPGSEMLGTRSPQPAVASGVRSTNRIAPPPNAAPNDYEMVVICAGVLPVAFGRAPRRGSGGILK